MKRLLALLCLLMLPATALAAKTRTKWTDVPEVVRPGKSARMIFTCPVETTAVITLLDTDGETVWAESKRASQTYIKRFFTFS